MGGNTKRDGSAVMSFSNCAGGGIVVSPSFSPSFCVGVCSPSGDDDDDKLDADFFCVGCVWTDRSF